MKKIIISFLFSLMIISILCGKVAAQQSEGEELFRVKIPAGFIYKTFHVSPAGMKALSFLEHRPESLHSNRSLVKIFDTDNLLIEEKVLDSGWIFGGFTPANALILLRGEGDSLSEARIVDLQWREILSVKNIGSRRLFCDVRGKEVALAALGYDSQYMPSVVYDLNSGQEKFRLEPFSLPDVSQPEKIPWTGTRIFLPVGQDNLFVWGIGATVLLQRYQQPGHIWKIDSIGGNIADGKFLGQDYLAVRYFVPEKKYREGLAIIRWRDGQIVFRIENYIANNRREKELPPLTVEGLYLQDDGFDLCLLNDDGRLLKIKFKAEKKTWDENIKVVRQYNFGKSIASGRGRPKAIKGHIYFADEESNEVVVKRIKLN
ncbi:MAG: hypothetical protein ACPLRX_09650 [Candidatus Saccharicenans sp.]